MNSNYELDTMLQEAVDGGFVEEGSPARGIARQCNDRGHDSLSPAQKAIYNRDVLPHLRNIQTQRYVEERRWGMPE